MEIKKVVHEAPTITDSTQLQRIRVRKVRFLCAKHAKRYERIHNTHVYPLTFFEKAHHKNKTCFDCTLEKEFIDVSTRRS